MPVERVEYNFLNHFVLEDHTNLRGGVRYASHNMHGYCECRASALQGAISGRLR